MPLPVILWLAACAAPEPFVEVGTGEVAFQALARGDTIEVIQGPQGGFHVLGSVRVAGVDPGDRDDLGSPRNPTVAFAMWDGEARVDLGLTYTQGLDTTDDRHVYEMVGRLVILDILDDDELAGRTLDLAARVEDADGVVLTDRRAVVAVPSPFNP